MSEGGESEQEQQQDELEIAKQKALQKYREMHSS